MGVGEGWGGQVPMTGQVETGHVWTINLPWAVLYYLK